MTRRIYPIVFLTVLLLFLTNSCTNKNNAISVETSRECVIDTVTVAETDSAIDDDVIQQMIDSIQSKEKITQQDIDFVKEHFIWDGDLAWCINMENKLKYDNLSIMRKKLYKNQKTSELAPLFEEEQKLFEKYKEACKNAFCTCQEVYLIGSGTGRSLFMSDIEDECCHQLMLADEDVLMQLCGEKPVVESYQKFTPPMITKAYAIMIEVQQDCDNNDSEVTRKEYSQENKQNLLRKEQKAWNQWMAYRATMSEKIPAEARKYFEDGTNNVMRHKLIQLKNQYANIGMIGNDVILCTLPYDCSDKDLMEYSSFDHVWSIYEHHSGDPKWADWRRSLIYKDRVPE